MRRFWIFFICFSSAVLFSEAQIASDTTRGVDCFSDAFIYTYINGLSDNNNTAFTQWYYEDEALGWVKVDTMLDVSLNDTPFFSDSLNTSRCGRYKLEVIDATLQVLDSAIWFLSCPLGIAPGQTNIKCFGDSTGMLKRSAHSGSSPYFYEWYLNGFYFSSGLNDTLFNNLVAGQYKVVVTDLLGCQDSITSNLFSPLPIYIDSSYVKDVSCIGDSTGSIILSVKGGKRYLSGEYYYFYLINGIDTVAYSDSSGLSSNFSSFNNPYFVQIDNLPAGSYQLSVVDSFSCLFDTSISISQPDSYVIYASTADSLICSFDSVWLNLDSVSGGGQFLDYSWIYGNLDSIFVPSGTYLLYVSDSLNGCLDTLSYTLDAEYEISVSITSQDILCYGDSTGSINIDSISGGTPPYSIQWGGINPYMLIAGTYTIIISDTIGCTLIESFDINQPSPININPTLYPPSCNGYTDGSIAININGGSGILSLIWQNGTGNIDSLYGITAGTYVLDIIDTSGCSYTDSITLSEPEEISISFTNYLNPLNCFGELTPINAIISGGTGPYNIQWSTSDTVAQIIIGAGTYNCSIIDTNGCGLLESITITQPGPFSISNLNYTDPICNQGGSAQITITGGTQPVNYFWSTGDTTQSISNILTNSAWVIATDDCGLTDSIGFSLLSYNLVTSLYYDNITHVASVEVDVSTTSGPFSYQWEDVFGNIVSNNANTSALCEGIYYVTTTDVSTGCIVIDTLQADFYLPSGSILDVSNTTVLSDSQLWGFEPYTYLWSSGYITPHADLCPGDHWLEVTDVNGCMVREDFTVDPFLLTLTPSEIFIECSLENLDVELEVSASGGTSPYTYSWSNGSTANPIVFGLSPGLYSVEVMDNNGCISDTSFTVRALTAECIPDIFSPNNDNINDVWDLEDAFLFDDTEIKVYGRYGKKIFESIGYSVAWDGTNDNGSDVPEGVYFYYIELGHGYEPIKGTVTIVR